MDEFVIMGLVLQEIEYGEADRILKILTAEKGLISAFAKNSMRLTSHLFAACGQLCYSEFVLRPGRNTEERMYTVVEAGYETDFRNIGYSFEAQGVAMYMVEFTLALSLAEQPAEKELKLLMNCLYKICQQRTAPKLVKAVFELRMTCERKRAGTATWTRARCSPCATSALWRTKNCSASVSRPPAPGCCTPRRSSMRWPIWTSR